MLIYNNLAQLFYIWVIWVSVSFHSLYNHIYLDNHYILFWIAIKITIINVLVLTNAKCYQIYTFDYIIIDLFWMCSGRSYITQLAGKSVEVYILKMFRTSLIA